MGIKAKLQKKIVGRSISEVWLGENYTYDWPDMAESDRGSNVPITIKLDNGALLLVYGQVHWISEKAKQTNITGGS